MARTKNGKSWMARHLSDPYVQKAQAQGYRSRASYKLLAINQKDKLFRPGMFILDLGAAPGGWSQVVASLVGPSGKVVAIDLLDMAPIPGVQFLQGDFLEEKMLEKLEELVGNQPLDWVISDMLPNLSGIPSADQPKIIYLAELALDFAKAHLKPQGGLLIKVFQGEGFEQFHKMVKQVFRQVVIRKPDASRSDSRELYVLARGYYNI